MKTFFMIKVMLLALSCSIYSQTHIYVKHDAAGANDGSSWTDAFTGLQPALTAANSGDFIWVAAGTYTPTAEVGGAGNRFKTFQLKNGVGLCGGFAGNEDPNIFDLDDRDFETNETILSGDLGAGVNVYHVFRHVNLGLNNTAVLDGFSISGGKSDGTDPDNKGGGMLNSGSSVANGSSPTIRNCVFKNNEATEGGALYNSRYSNPAVSHTTFTNNTAATKGGAVFNIRNTPTYSNCTFSSNEITGSASNDGGGAIYNSTSNAAEGAVISHCVFTNNTVPSSGTATYGGGAIFSSLDPGTISITFSTFTGNSGKYGGAIYHRSGNDANRDASDVKISNSTFEQNSAEYGGAIFSDRHHSIVTSCVIKGNEAAEQSGGFYSRFASSELINTLVSGNKSGKHGGGVYFNTESPDIINSTITGNYSGERGGGISMINGSTVSLNNSIVWGNASPEGNELWLCGDCIANIDYSLYGNATGDVFITSGGAVNATNSSTSDPLYLNHIAPTSGNTPNTSGNYLIKSTSPAIDAGLNTYLPVTVTADLRGRDRIIDGDNNSSAVIDMGAYEYDPDYCNSTAPTLGNGAITTPYQISTLGHLCWISQNSGEWNKHYIQTSNIDASDTQFWDDGKGFTPIANSSIKFTGTYNGQGFTISNLNINRATSNEIGLFGDVGQASGYRATIQNLSLVNASVTGKDQVGLLAGRANRDIDFINCHVNGSVSGNRNVGGMVGDVNHVNILHCSSSATVGVNNQGDVRYHGGLIGLINGSSSTVKQSYATGSVTGANRIGGLVGAQGYNTTVENCFASGNVYPTTSIQTSPMIGGLVGEVYQAILRYSYSTGAVDITGLTAQYGGLVGTKNTSSPFADVDNFWDTQTSGLTTSELGTGKITTEMQTQSTFTNWDFQCETANGTDYVWGINTTNNNQYPFLSWQGYISANCPVWNGSSTDWATASNWSTSAVPADYYSIVIPSSQTHYPVLDQNRIVGNLQIANGAFLTIPPLQGLTVEGTLTNDAGVAGVVIQSDASGTGSLIYNGNIAASATAQRYIEGWSVAEKGWHFLSSPVSSQAVQPEFVSNPPAADEDFYFWNEANNEWVNAKTSGFLWNEDFDDNLVTGKGYLAAYQAGDTKVFSGPLNVSDVYISGLTNTETSYSRGWNLIGNPYTAALLWDASDDAWNLSNIESIAKIWHADNASYSDIENNTHIPAMQGFMVRVSNNQTGSLTLPKSKLIHSNQAWYKSKVLDKLTLTVTDLELLTAQETRIGFNEAASNSYDKNLDSYFLSGYAPMFFTSIEGKAVSTNVMPAISQDLTIPLYFYKTSAAQYKMQVQGTTTVEPWPVYLTDRVTGQRYDLNTQPEFIFSASENDRKDRFLLHFNASTAIQETAPGTNISAQFANGEIIIINPKGETGIINLVDLTGRVLSQTKLSSEESLRVNANYPTGIYIISIKTEKGTMNSKMFIR